MRLPCCKKRFASLPALNGAQRRRARDALRPAAGRDQLLALLALRPDRCCPGCSSCASTAWHRHGQANGVRRYCCRHAGAPTTT